MKDPESDDSFVYHVPIRFVSTINLKRKGKLAQKNYPQIKTMRKHIKHVLKVCNYKS